MIIIGRGGGSIEDLWAFNDEGLALCVAASHIPVISAVGHESDFTICDFVADKRAPTPSAAAELAVPDRSDLLRGLNGVSGKLASFVLQKIQANKNTLKYLRESGVLSSAAPLLNEKRMGLLYAARRLDGEISNTKNRANADVSAMAARLEAVSPLSVLARGYSVVADTNGNAIRSVSNVNVGDGITVRVSDGTVRATVQSIQKESCENGK